MRGQILGVDARTGDGLLSGEDGRRYRFTPTDWADRGEPAVGLAVDFEAHDARALNIFPLPGARAVEPSGAAPAKHRSEKNKFVAALLAFFLGTLGIHRFYLGRVGSGIVMLVLTMTIIGLLATGLWALIDAVRYLMMSDEEFATRYPPR